MWKNSFNSYPIDSLAQKIGEASLNDETYFQKSVSKIITTREKFQKWIDKCLDFQVTDSKNQIFFVIPPKNEMLQHFSKYSMKQKLLSDIGIKHEFLIGYGLLSALIEKWTQWFNS